MSRRERKSKKLILDCITKWGEKSGIGAAINGTTRVIPTDILIIQINPGKERKKKKIIDEKVVNPKSREIFRGRNAYFIDSGLRKYPGHGSRRIILRKWEGVIFIPAPRRVRNERWPRVGLMPYKSWSKLPLVQRIHAYSPSIQFHSCYVVHSVRLRKTRVGHTTK